MIRLVRPCLLALSLCATPLMAQDTHEVRITGSAYEPAVTRAAGGDTVVFFNDHDRPHTATADDASFDTGRIRPGESARVIVSGPIGFADRFNPRLRGAIE